MYMYLQARVAMESDYNRLVWLQHKFVRNNLKERLLHLKDFAGGVLKDSGGYRENLYIQVHHMASQ